MPINQKLTRVIAQLSTQEQQVIQQTFTQQACQYLQAYQSNKRKLIFPRMPHLIEAALIRLADPANTLFDVLTIMTQLRCDLLNCRFKSRRRVQLAKQIAYFLANAKNQLNEKSQVMRLCADVVQHAFSYLPPNQFRQVAATCRFFKTQSATAYQRYYYYGKTACQKRIVSYKGMARFEDLTLLPDGHVACIADFSHVKIWQLNTGRCISSLKVNASSLAALPSGYLICGSYKPAVVEIWDWRQKQRIAVLEGHTHEIHSIAVLSNRFIACGDWAGFIKLWDIESGQCLNTFGGYQPLVSALAVLPNGYLASGTSNGLTAIWNPSTGECIRELEGHSAAVKDFQVLNNNMLISAACDHTIRLWDITTGQCKKILLGHSGSVYALELLPQGHLVSLSRDNTIRIWDLTTGQQLNVTHFGANKEYYSLHDTMVVLADGTIIFSNNDSSTYVFVIENSIRSLKFAQMPNQPLSTNRHELFDPQAQLQSAISPG